jgi:hypothetical protein
MNEGGRKHTQRRVMQACEKVCAGGTYEWCRPEQMRVGAWKNNGVHRRTNEVGAGTLGESRQV